MVGGSGECTRCSRLQEIKIICESDDDHSVRSIGPAPDATGRGPSVTCLSCRTKGTSQWYKVSWDLTGRGRHCAACYGQYSKSGSSCYKCHRVYSEVRMRQKGGKELLVSQILENDEKIRGYPCDHCDGVIVEREKKRVARQSILTAGKCYVCKIQKPDTCWRDVPWKAGFQWCGTCRSRFHLKT